MASTSCHLGWEYMRPLKTNIVQHLKLSCFCLSDHPPIRLSFHVLFDSSINLLFHSILPWLSWQLLGLMPSQCSAPSWPLERRLHSLSRYTRPPFSIALFSPLWKSLIQSFTSCRIHTLPFSHLSPSLSSSTADQLVSWGSDRNRDRKLADRNYVMGSAQKICQPSPEHHPHCTASNLHLGLHWCLPPEKRKPQTNSSWFLQHKRWMHSQTSSFKL